MVDDPDFISMVHALDPAFHVPVRSTIKRRLVNVEVHVRSALKLKLNKIWVSVPSITTDHWTSGTNEGYASFTIHYIDTKWIL